jgi:hypothetical protein
MTPRQCQSIRAHATYRRPASYFEAIVEARKNISYWRANGVMAKEISIQLGCAKGWRQIEQNIITRLLAEEIANAHTHPR